MKSMFNPADSGAILARIENLSAGAQAQWGKMTVAQALVHMQQPILVALGELKLKRGLIGILFGKMAKKKMANEELYERNLPTDKHFIVRHDPVFEDEKTKLIALVQRFANGGAEALSKEPHPFFGPLTTQEWDILQWKHLDHHLRQFGA